MTEGEATAADRRAVAGLRIRYAETPGLTVNDVQTHLKGLVHLQTCFILLQGVRGMPILRVGGILPQQSL
jgi:hypothetical protein